MGTAAALACVGGSAAGTQVALDGVDTGIRSGVNGEFRAAGTIQGVQRAVKTGDAVHIAEAVIAPAQTAAIAAGGAAVARAVASANMASEQNLSGTGQSLTKPPAQATPALTPENLAAVSQQAPRPSPLVPPEVCRRIRSIGAEFIGRLAMAGPTRLPAVQVWGARCLWRGLFCSNASGAYQRKPGEDAEQPGPTQ